MNIIVPIKQVPDTGMNLQIQEGKINETGLKWVISPYDEFALEEALKLKAHLPASKLFALSLGPERAKEALLTALALGADEAFHLIIEKLPQNPLITAQILKEKLAEIPEISIVFCGKLSTDSNNFAVPQMLAAFLNLPFVTNINKLEYREGFFHLSRECGAGQEELLRAKAPLLLSADKGLNTPRYPSLPGIMKARGKPFHSQTVEIKQKDCLNLIQLSPPPEKQAPQILQGTSEEQVQKLIKLLKEKEKIL